MGNPYPAKFTDDNLRLRLDGSVTFSDAANQPGGSSAAVAMGVYLHHTAFNPPLTVPSGVDTSGPWVLVNGTELLDHTVPTNPSVLVDGFYMLQAASILFTGSDQAGKYAQVSVEFDTDDNAVGANSLPLELNTHGGAVGSVAQWPVSTALYMTAGMKVGYFILHNAGTDQPFKFGGLLVRLTGVTGTVLTP